MQCGEFFAWEARKTGILPCETDAFRGTLSPHWLAPLAGRDPMQLRMSTRLIENIMILDCHGRIVFGDESAQLRDMVKKLISEGHSIVLNLGGVHYIDSGGLGTLVGLYTSARNASVGIKLAHLTPRIGDLLQVTKLVTVFEVYDTEEDAVKAFSKGAVA